MNTYAVRPTLIGTLGVALALASGSVLATSFRLTDLGTASGGSAINASGHGAGCAATADTAEACVPRGRLDFATVPEHAFVRGQAETVQLGIWQLDPLNRWTPGDQTRESGWKSRFPTRLVFLDTGAPRAGFAYDGETGELHYDGSATGDLMVRIERLDGRGKSNDFRIRAFNPTVVYGHDAAAVNAEHSWGAVVCETVTFAACRKMFKGGLSDSAPLVIFITTGNYAGQDWYLGGRRSVYVIGAAEWPTLNGDELSNSYGETFYVKNLVLRTTRIKFAHPLQTATNRLFITNVKQCCETGDANGVVNPNGFTAFRWDVFIWNFVGTGMGSLGNQQHQFYIEGRPDSHFELNNVQILGTRGSSAIKTTMQYVAVRHSVLSTSAKIGDPNIGTPAGGHLMHTPIDVPAVSDSHIYGNVFYMWRQGTAGIATGYSGMLTASIYWRQRWAMYGSDIPAYPNLSWDPPLSSQKSSISPGKGWPKGCETFVDPAFWADVKSKPITDPTNELAFQHWVSFNKFVLMPGSRHIRPLRDDGTHPVYGSPPTATAKRTHVDWLERSVTHWFDNEYEGFAEGAELFDMKNSQPMNRIEPRAKWPRTKDEEFPHAVALGGELPDWFKL